MNHQEHYMALLRVRAFTQDDAHIFCSEDQITSECLRSNKFNFRYL